MTLRAQHRGAVSIPNLAARRLLHVSDCASMEKYRRVSPRKAIGTGIGLPAQG
jgi:hypothetical protein